MNNEMVIAVLAGILALNIIFWLEHCRKDKHMHENDDFLYLHYDRSGECDYIRFKGNRYYK